MSEASTLADLSLLFWEDSWFVHRATGGIYFLFLEYCKNSLARGLKKFFFTTNFRMKWRLKFPFYNDPLKPLYDFIELGTLGLNNEMLEFYFWYSTFDEKMMKRKSYEKIVSRNPCEEENFNLQNDGGSSYKKFFLTFEFLQFSSEKSILTFHFSLLLQSYTLILNYRQFFFVIGTFMLFIVRISHYFEQLLYTRTMTDDIWTFIAN